MVTHDELNKIGAKWLKKHHQNGLIPNCTEIAVDLKTGTKTGETPDVLGWCFWCSVLIETKVSRSDFFADQRKIFRIEKHLGVGNFRYYLMPKGLVKEDEVPDDWGLLYYSKNGIEIVRNSKSFLNNMECERTILLSILRRKRNN